VRVSVFEEGLPASFFTRWRAVATGLAIAGVAIAGFDVFALVTKHVSEPKKAPACYGRQHVAGRQGIPPRGERDAQGHSVDDRLSGIDTDRITLALRICTTQSCPSGALKDYRSAMSWYLFYRLQHTSQLYRSYGDAGLARAREIYREPIDVLVEQGMRERYAAGVFRVNDFLDRRTAIAIIVFGGGDALRPCTAADPDTNE